MQLDSNAVEERRCKLLAGHELAGSALVQFGEEGIVRLVERIERINLRVAIVKLGKRTESKDRFGDDPSSTM